MVQANTVLAPFNLSPRRELPSHVKAHERQELMDKEKEEEASRCAHNINPSIRHSTIGTLPILPILGLIVALEKPLMLPPYGKCISPHVF